MPHRHAVADFAAHRASALAEAVQPSVDPGADVAARAEALAGSLSANSYAATTEKASAQVTPANHSVPVIFTAAVAARFWRISAAGPGR